MLSDILVRKMELYLDKKRPPEEIRDKLDFTFKINGQEITIYEIRPHFKDKNIKIETPVAKTKYVKSKKIWKVYWMRGDLKWYLYDPDKEVSSLDEFLEIVDEDKYGCFWG